MTDALNEGMCYAARVSVPPRVQLSKILASLGHKIITSLGPNDPQALCCAAAIYCVTALEAPCDSSCI